jgi:signal transduction histidine kinase
MNGRASAWRDVRTWLAARPLVADTAFAVALLLAELALWALGGEDLRTPLPPESLAWLAVGLAPVAIRRRWPWVAAVAASLQNTVTGIFGLYYEGIAIAIVTYTIAAYKPLRASILAALGIWVPPMVAAGVYERYAEGPIPLTLTFFLVFNTMACLVAFLTGRTVFARRRYVAALVEQARTAELNQQALSAQAVTDERRRIARELHDMVAHHVSVMGVLATASRRTLRRDPDAADEALATIEETGRTVLREMRRLLDVLRTEPDPYDPLAPAPGLSSLEGLIEQVREAGLPVTLSTNGDVDGGAPAMDPGAALTVYRITQEALTNVLKHGGAQATAEVRLDVGTRWLVLEVFDTGRGPAGGEDGTVGHGLAGMRERVALYGGTLRTGPRPGGGYRVYARIPVKEDAHE